MSRPFPVNDDEQRRATTDAEQLLADLVRETLVEKRRSRRWSIFFRLIGVLLVLGLIGALLARSQVPGMSDGGQHTAVVRIKGVIAEGAEASAEPVIEALETALEHPGTQGVVLLINSPGGSPVQSDLIFEGIRRLRSQHPDIPVHAVVEDMAASGGYYIAAAADRIYANPTSLVGSIGVRMDSFGLTEAMQRLGVERRLLVAGENKGLLDPFQPVDPTVQTHLQGVIDSVHERFIEAVREGRGERLVETDELFTGLVWSGTQAIELGLVDELLDVRTVAREVIGEAERRDFTRERSIVERLGEGLGASLGLAIRRGLGLELN